MIIEPNAKTGDRVVLRDGGVDEIGTVVEVIRDDTWGGGYKICVRYDSSPRGSGWDAAISSQHAQRYLRADPRVRGKRGP